MLNNKPNLINNQIPAVNHERIEEVLGKLHNGIHKWVEVVLPSLVNGLNDHEIKILALRLNQVFGE